MKKETAIKVNRNERFVLSSKSLNYTFNKENNSTTCKGDFEITFRGFPIQKVTIADFCTKLSTDEYNEEFGKKLSRAKMERNAYMWFKNYLMEIPLSKITFATTPVQKKEINPHQIIKYINNSIRFAEDMIKHQNNYIYKVLKK
jgi:hypothetical protein